MDSDTESLTMLTQRDPEYLLNKLAEGTLEVQTPENKNAPGSNRETVATPEQIRDHL